MAPPALQFCLMTLVTQTPVTPCFFFRKDEKSCQKIREPQWECCNFAAG